MMTQTVVAVVRCPDYSERHVTDALAACLSHVGDMNTFVKPGDKVLIKVNLLSPKSPDKAVTTHPALLKAVIESVKQAGGIPYVGDSSGGMMKGNSSTSRALDVSGVQETAERAGATVINFDRDRVIRVDNNDNSLADHFMMAAICREADVIINLPKLKTHSATLFTGAVKNMFGCIPGYQKAEYHKLAPKLEDFARILVDIYAKTRPALNIMDGILSMEGNGPAHGNPRMTGLLIASQDGVALDAVASKIIGFDPMRIDTTRIAHEMNVGNGDINYLDIQGISLGEAKIKGFSLPSNAILAKIPPFWVKRGLGFLASQPYIVKTRCTRCGFCQENCPVQAITLDKEYPAIEREKCILCYCCQELCPQGAVIVQHRSPILRGILGLRSR